MKLGLGPQAFHPCLGGFITLLARTKALPLTCSGATLATDDTEPRFFGAGPLGSLPLGGGRHRVVRYGSFLKNPLFNTLHLILSHDTILSQPSQGEH